MLIIAFSSFAGCQKDENKDITQTIHVIIDTLVTVPNTVQDVDGNTYPVIEVGAHRWMARNLRSTRYANGDLIAHVPNAPAWSGLSTSAWAIYGSEAGFVPLYGYLYNYYTVQDPRNVCPEGWHVPSDVEWQELETELGMAGNELVLTGSRGASGNVGGKLKSTVLWSLPNTGANDSLDFEGLPGGVRSSSGGYAYEGQHAWWWTSTQIDANTATYRSLHNDNAGVFRLITNKRQGVSIRCVED